MSSFARALQLLGVLVVVASACFPTLQLRVFPTEHGASPWQAASFLAGVPEVPSRELGSATLASLRGESGECPFWSARRWYPWYLALLWLPALWLVRGRPRGDRRRRWVGGLLWTLTGVLLVFEAAYLYAEYLPLLPGLAGQVEGLLAWGLVAAVLLYRRKADRALGAVEAVVAGQALLGFLHALTLPGTMGRAWVGAYPLGSVAEALWINFPPAFWLGTAGLLLAALPVYLGRRAPSPNPDPPSSAPPS